MISTETTTDTRQARNATERTAESVRHDAHEVTEKADRKFQQLPTVDLVKGVERYFEFVQKAVDVNRELGANWANSVNSLAGVVREQTEKAGQSVIEQTDKASELTREQAGKVEQTEKDQAVLARRSTDGHSDDRDERSIDTQ